MLKFFIVFLSLLGFSLVACDTYYVEEGQPGPQGPAGPQGEKGDPGDLADEGDVCPDGGYAATEPWGRLYHTDSMPEFQERGENVLYADGLARLFHTTRYLDNLDGCGKGFTLNGIRFVFRGITPTAEMDADLLIDGQSYGGVGCIPLNGGNGGGIDEGDGVKCFWDLDVLFVSADPKELGVWVYGVPYTENPFNVELDLWWTDISTAASHVTMFPLFFQY